MRLSVIALDYDGTIACNDVLDLSVREAILDARARGFLVLLVTGRILEDLRRVAGDLRFVDGVVAENGAVLHFPDREYTSSQASPIPEAFLAELRRRNIPFQAGRCIVSAEAADGARALEVIRDLELPLVLVFNRDRVMTVPQGISKATGLKVAMEMLRLSPHGAVAVGDAENDHELLRFVGVGAAVEWGSAALRSRADVIIRGLGPEAVAGYVRMLAETGRLPTPARERRRLVLGHTDDGHQVSVAARGRNVLVTSDQRPGRSLIAGLLCEQMVLHKYCVCVIDPRGDYRSLGTLPGVTVLGSATASPSPRELAHVLRYPDQSVVIDLSYRQASDKIASIRALLPALNRLRQRTGLPHQIVLGEAQDYLNDTNTPGLDPEQYGCTVATSSAARLPTEVFASADVIVVTGESNSSEVEALRRRCGAFLDEDAIDWSVLMNLSVGKAVALPLNDATQSGWQRFTISPGLTAYGRPRRRYWDVPVSDHRAFVFGADGRTSTERVRTLQQLVAALESRPVEQVAANFFRGDLSRWLRNDYGDDALANDVRLLEERNRHSVSKVTVSELVSSIRARYQGQR